MNLNQNYIYRGQNNKFEKIKNSILPNSSNNFSDALKEYMLETIKYYNEEIQNKKGVYYFIFILI